MPTLSAPQITKVQQIQTDINAFKNAAETLVTSCNSLMADMIAVNTTASLQASNALLILKGAARGCKGKMEEAHGAASNALLAYDAPNGGGIVVAGPGR